MLSQPSKNLTPTGSILYAFPKFSIASARELAMITRSRRDFTSQMAYASPKTAFELGPLHVFSCLLAVSRLPRSSENNAVNGFSSCDFIRSNPCRSVAKLFATDFHGSTRIRSRTCHRESWHSEFGFSQQSDQRAVGQTMEVQDPNSLFRSKNHTDVFRDRDDS